ncbi:hypothetical protein [Mycobacterium marinum]|nr:hypothetical protein [Mycobacterium marinum]
MSEPFSHSSQIAPSIDASRSASNGIDIQRADNNTANALLTTFS